MMSNLLATHTSGAHQTQPVGPAPASTKLVKLPRPTFALNMSEAQWDSYIGQGPVSADQKLHRLQVACDQDLPQRMYDAGNYRELSIIELFMTQLKKLAVLVVHHSIHALNMWKMQQQPKEQRGASTSTVTGVVWWGQPYSNYWLA